MGMRVLVGMRFWVCKMRVLVGGEVLLVEMRLWVCEG